MKRFSFRKSRKDPIQEMERRLEEEMEALRRELVSLEKDGSGPLQADSAQPEAPRLIVEHQGSEKLSSQTWDLEPESMPNDPDEKETSEEAEIESGPGWLVRLKLAWQVFVDYCSRKWGRFKRRAPVWIRRGIREAQASILDPSAETFQNKNAPPLLRNEKRRARNRFFALAVLFSIVIFFILKKIYSDY